MSVSEFHLLEPVKMTNPGGVVIYGIQFFQSLVDEPPMISAEGRVLTRRYWEQCGWAVEDVTATPRYPEVHDA